MAIHRIVRKKIGSSNQTNYVGNSGEIFLNDGIPDLRLSDGITPGGISLSSGISTSNINTGYANTAGISTVSQGLIGTPNISVGVVTGTSFYGNGSNLTGVITSLVGYATEGYVNNQGFVTSGIVVGYATQGYVTNSLVGYATTGDVIYAISQIPTFDQDLNTTNDVTFNRLGVTAGEINVGFNSDLLINLSNVEDSSTYIFGSSGTLSVPRNIEIGGGGPSGYVLFNNNGSNLQAEPNNDFRIHAGGFGNQVWSFSTDGSLTFPNGSLFIGTSITTPVPNDIFSEGDPFSIRIYNAEDQDFVSFRFENNRLVFPDGNGRILSGDGEWFLDSVNKELSFPSVGDRIFYDTWYGVGLDIYTYDKPIRITAGQTNIWAFSTDGSVTFPDNTIQTTAFTGYAGLVTSTGDGSSLTGIVTSITAGSGISISQSTGNVTITATGGGGGDYTSVAGIATYATTAGVSTTTNTIDITNTNGLTTIYYPTFVESRTTGQYLRADVDLTYRTDTNTLTVGGGLTATSIRASGIITANSFRPSSGYYQSGNGTNAFYVYDGTGNVAFQGNINVNQINSGSGYKAIEFSGETTPTVLVPNGVNVTGVVTASSFKGSGSSLTGIVTSITAGSGISIDQSTGNVTITNTGGGGGGVSGVTIKDEGATVGTAGSTITLNFVGDNVTATASGTASTITVATQTYVETAGVATYSSTSGISTYATTSGVSTTAGYATTAGIATVAQGLSGTPNLTAGVITATSYYGSGVHLTGIVTSIVAGSGISVSQSTGIVTVTNTAASLTGNNVFTGINTFTGSNTFSGSIIIEQSSETFNKYSTSIASAGIVTFNCSSGNIHYITSTVSGNWTANLTNVGVTSGYCANYTLVITQGTTAYIPTALQIDGVSQTLNWQGGSQPSGNNNKKDIIAYTVFDDAGTYTVFAQLVTFG